MANFGKRAIGCTALVVGLGLATPGHSAEDVGNETLIIHLRKALKASTKAQKGDALKAWQKACDNLGRAMVKGGGLWGYGPYASYSCLFQGKVQAKHFKAPSAWILEVDQKKNAVSFSLAKAFKDPKSANATLEAVTTVPTAGDGLAYLAQPDVAKVVAFDLADKLPFGMAVSPEAVEIKSSQVFSTDAALPEPPANLVIYSLRFDARKSRWVPVPRGSAKLTEFKVEEAGEDAPAALDKKKRGRAKDKAKGPKRKAEAAWAVTWDARDREEGPLPTVFWASDARGRGMNGKGAAETLAAIATKSGAKEESFAETLLDQVAAGYVGVRFGQSILKGDPLLVNARFVGIFTEVRSGFLDGLRFYADIGLEKKAHEHDLDLSFRWRRYTFGWSFFKDLDWWITRVDLVPKIGIMDIRAVVPLASLTEEGKFTAGTFSMTNAFNFGAELGVEKQMGWSLFRLWGASDFAVGFLQKAGGGRGTISSLRGGLDAYFDVLKLGKSLELSLLLFGLGERISLSQDASKQKAADDAAQVIEGLNYTYGFVGAGLSLAW